MVRAYDAFLGVFAPSGELDAVEESPDMAAHSAIMLGPNELRKQGKTNRTVEPVTIIRGDLADLVATMLAVAVDGEAAKRYAELEKLVARCTTTDQHGHPVVVASNELLQAKERFAAALKLKLAL